MIPAQVMQRLLFVPETPIVATIRRPWAMWVRSGRAGSPGGSDAARVVGPGG